MSRRRKQDSGIGRFSGWHVAVAAEAVAAAQFARCGVDVSVQYGANQPEYDLVITAGERMLKVSVKGSVTGSWGLTQSLLQNADYHGAVDRWLARHKPKTIFCFVQFRNVAFHDMPRLYLAHPIEVADRLKGTARGRGDTILFEAKIWSSRAYAAGTVDEIPSAWRFTPARLDSLLEQYG